MKKVFLLAIVVSAWLISAPAISQKVNLKIGATLTVTDRGAWRPVFKGIEYRKLVFERSEPGYTLELKLFRFDPGQISTQVLDAAQFQLTGAEAKTFAEKSGALAAINANYFNENGRPLAYLKSAAKEINRAVSKHALYTGIFGVREGRPFIMHRDGFQPPEASQALQSGPLLLHRGAPVDIMPGLGRYARRAVIGIDKQERVLAAATDAILGGLSFAELQELFSNPKWQLETPDLLNLDGGGSAQLYVRAGKFEESVAGTAEVPVAIGFFAVK
jgi:uncharacterized protein YigE (DUF2233 family)